MSEDLLDQLVEAGVYIFASLGAHPVPGFKEVLVDKALQMLRLGPQSRELPLRLEVVFVHHEEHWEGSSVLK